ncbi:MAG: GNAT family N-acetyltransferase [Candidatus Competibacteraceae bacterium]|nr:GNAT family N-acetyltransferase [Candidatus Competibacteraceae bacterium]MBK7984816.1 GNAT family N-acetyltransferase [Candidatus Competibacteraceae bacterium]MBK8899421.1 GNAT family N-acetyltransferase [Candidatus Competibacteraceae bacterium]MBK8964426.1 GNAT family N-acetyltransferase [Candidatus Competibacteraceae bacterium]MBK9952415.1 GNAT family N-acetyltransferase [Candidatus Competibacteraceae bacterium]
MQIVSGISTEFSGDLTAKVARYRYAVFVERLGWNLRTRDGAELDQFDRPDTVYLVAQGDDGRILGCARLLPTVRPYLLGEVFSELLNGLPAPCSPEVWELSRFAAVDFDGRSAATAGIGSSAVAIGLLGEAIRYAATQGAKRLITISPLGVERLLHRAGFHAHRAGPPTIIDGLPFFACWIETLSS